MHTVCAKQRRRCRSGSGLWITDQLAAAAVTGAAVLVDFSAGLDDLVSLDVDSLDDEPLVELFDFLSVSRLSVR